MKRAFTLVEILIVVAILGILAAIVLPQFQSHSQQAKETAAKDNLRILRNTVEVYAAQHNETPPGYYNDGRISPLLLFPYQFTAYTSINGLPSSTKSSSFPFGPYLQEFPVNPFNNKTIVRILGDTEPFPSSADGTWGWIYKPAEKVMKIDWPGEDSEGAAYYSY